MKTSVVTACVVLLAVSTAPAQHFASTASVSQQTFKVDESDLGAQFTKMIVVGDPNHATDPVTPADRVDPNTTTSAFAGVVSINPIHDTLGSFIGSGTMISGKYILTAAHVVDLDDNGIVDINFNDTSVVFNAGTSLIVTGIANATIHPNYTGFLNPTINDDIAIIELVDPAPASVPIYPIVTAPFDFTEEIVMVGYGRSGDGVSGWSVPPDFFVKRTGQNLASTYGVDDEGTGSKEIFYFDFDGRNRSTDTLRDGRTLGNFFETTIGGGDSGGPSFIWNDTGDSIPQANELSVFGVNTFSSGGGRIPVSPLFGSQAGGMVVSSYQDFITSTVPEQTALFALTGTQHEDVNTLYESGINTMNDSSTASVVSGGNIPGELQVYDSSAVTMTDGLVNQIKMYGTSTATISGGSVNQITTYGGTLSSGGGTINVGAMATLGDEEIDGTAGFTLTGTDLGNKAVARTVGIPGGTVTITGATVVMGETNLSVATSATLALAPAGGDVTLGDLDMAAGVALAVTGSVPTVNLASISGGTSIDTGGSAIVTAGSIVPGNSIGTLTITGDATISPGGTLVAEVQGATSSDLLAVTGTGGTLTMTGAEVQLDWLEVPLDDTSKFGGVYTIATYTSLTGVPTVNTDGNIGAAYVDTVVDAGTALQVTLHDLGDGDTNLDGVVDSLDLADFGQGWGLSNPTWADGDFDFNGVVDSLDLSAFGQAWGWSAGSAGAAAGVNPVPEPGTIVMLLIGAAGVLFYRKRR